MLPAEEIIPRAGLALQDIESLKGFPHIHIIFCIFDKGAAASKINFYHISVFLIVNQFTGRKNNVFCIK